MTATSTPEPVAELVAPAGYRWRWKGLDRINWVYCDIAPEYRVDERIIEPLYSASTIATLTAERDAATARIAELEALRAEVRRLRKVLEAIGGLTHERGTKDAVRTALDLRNYVGPIPPSKDQ
jgi:hypothetical protein